MTVFTVLEHVRRIALASALVDAKPVRSLPSDGCEAAWPALASATDFLIDDHVDRDAAAPINFTGSIKSRTVLILRHEIDWIRPTVITVDQFDPPLNVIVVADLVRLGGRLEIRKS